MENLLKASSLVLVFPFGLSDCCARMRCATFFSECLGGVLLRPSFVCVCVFCSFWSLWSPQRTLAGWELRKSSNLRKWTRVSSLWRRNCAFRAKRGAKRIEWNNVRLRSRIASLARRSPLTSVHKLSISILFSLILSTTGPLMFSIVFSRSSNFLPTKSSFFWNSSKPPLAAAPPPLLWWLLFLGLPELGAPLGLPPPCPCPWDAMLPSSFI